MQTTSQVALSEKPWLVDLAEEEFDSFLHSVHLQFAKHTNREDVFFLTSATNLFDDFLNQLPIGRRKHYTCTSCRQFFHKYGSLVSIDDVGNITSALWNPDTAPAFFKNAAAFLRDKVISAPIETVFYSEFKTWGLPKNRATSSVTGEWTHFSVTPGKHYLFKKKLETPDQAMALKKEEFGMLSRGLADYSHDHIAKAYSLLTSSNLYRSEKCIGVAEFLLRLSMNLSNVPKHRHDAFKWKAVATAPVGFCHVRSGMIGTLLDDIKQDLPFEDIKRKFDEKMNSLKYQRPQAAPSAGNIAQANKIIKKLESEGSLGRRFATLEEIHAIWRPTPQKRPDVKEDGVFSHLMPKKKESSVKVDQPATVMTFDKFRKTVLPSMVSAECYVNHITSLGGIVTAVNMEAPPILQWDFAEERNPFSWYLYHGGSSPSSWGISSRWTKVNAITLRPNLWCDEEKWNLVKHQGLGAIFVLDGCWDHREPSLCLFPEILKSEFHSIRSTMEAYNRTRKIQNRENATACGLIASGESWDVQLHVVLNTGIQQTIKIDRWD